ncbi:homogentisate 1,2-dioxygenase [Tumebacillus permanentifrigoris]|uniref:Homogentisate 1,2-dioxygenase n=1 Tax=Tumebacillus permanentifrigoris TaxID=378543 RepID=A0A316DTJ7_9BACL|nr:homogentisate 1,2-dioxygenase [Tumebacillus permanentifrigoris]PWK10339.1 homogentisate 1,2-dioxygenase [Tumebacillus permanentifrigoris]
MPFYQSLGEVPHKRHTQFRKQDGTLYREELMGTKGFSGISSLLYHANPPTQVKRVEKIRDLVLEAETQGPLQHRHFFTNRLEKGGDPIDGRTVLMFNDDVTIGLCQPTEPMNYFYRNGEQDEFLFVHEGEGQLETVFGTLPYHKGDYLVIPMGTTYRVVTATPSKFLVIESASAIETPKRYRNEFGQLLEHSPFCERDIRPPSALETHTESGEFEVRVKARGMLTAYFFEFHPLDVVGWDGYLFPYAFNIEDFEPITGRLHQPPPVHQTFQAHNFVICSFVPRLYDYHPQSIPAPYFHSNIESDEVLYYVDGNFMSRKGIEEGSITIHPMGIPHGPHPGTIEASIGKTETQELAVMVDTFRPLHIAKRAQDVEDPKYMMSWNPNA